VKPCVRADVYTCVHVMYAHASPQASLDFAMLTYPISR
jgi:hypothetical protein